MSEIIVGKYTLETLTSGMYADPYAVYREYIQNAVDSIDAADELEVISRKDANIEIYISHADSQVIIKDNGLGIPCQETEKTLISIGNSRKTSDKSRGFRGIGRLSALSYCDKLTFCTSYPGEECGTRVIVDAKLLAELLADSNSSDVTVSEVLKKSYKIETFNEKKERHYFTVKMEGVGEQTGLTSYEDVAEYLSQSAPAPYNPQFIWGKEIVRRLEKEGYEIKSYNIDLKYGLETTKIYKPYRDEFLVDKGKNLIDRIQDIEIIGIKQPDGSVSALGWVAKTNYLGSIYDKTVKGIRLRKGNILIGDLQTLNATFRDARFNGWTIGEIFAVDTQLIPNARRDNFEKNTAYFMLFEQLTAISASIVKEIRAASLKRNSELSRVMEQVESTSRAASEAILTGVTSQRKGALAHELKSAQEQMSGTRVNSEYDESCQAIAFEDLDMLIGKLKGATSYKALNTIEKITNTEKKILERVFNVINEKKFENSAEVIEAILDNFAG